MGHLRRVESMGMGICSRAVLCVAPTCTPSWKVIPSGLTTDPPIVPPWTIKLWWSHNKVEIYCSSRPCYQLGPTKALAIAPCSM